MNGTTYTGLTPNYAGPTQPYVIPPLQEPLPASPIRAATTNGYASGPQPARPKAMEQHVSITLNSTSCTRLTRAQTSLSAPSTNFPSWPAPLPQSFTPVPISNSKDRHSKQADSSQQPTNQVNTVNSAPSQTRPRANTGRKTVEQHRRDAMKRDGVYSAPVPPVAAADLAHAINSLSVSSRHGVFTTS